jgi:NAD(P)-dependent dehydrogenase (short-subunit alcohol dehydrogenase family)
MSRVLITGGNRGIGWELAQLYAAGGHQVILGVRTAPKGVLPIGITCLPLDVATDNSVRDFANQIGDTTIDVLINNAGILGPERQSTLNMDFEGFLAVLNTNTLGPLRVAQALLPCLRRSTSPKIGILTSRMGSMSYAKSDTIAYRASKTAANKVSQALATDLRPDGISIAAIHPGWARTEMGGPGADIDPLEAAQGIKSVLDHLTLEATGQFWNYDGQSLEW